VEIDKLKKQAKDNAKEQLEKIEKKNKIINDLLTESENTKTEVNILQQQLNIKKSLELKITSDYDAIKEKLTVEQ